MSSNTSGFGPPAAPAPDPGAAQHSAQLTAVIRAEMDVYGGALPFDRFMDLALYAPNLGYYVAGARKFGEGGDFVTAPEISPLFAQSLAAQCQQVLEGLGGGSILEFGAGTGVLAVDLLRELERLGSLPQRYLILELSPELQARQGALLAARVPQLLRRVQWVNRLPEPFSGVVLANEVLDAMPVHRFSIGAAGEIEEIFVHWDGTGFREFAVRAVSSGLWQAVSALRRQGLALEAGYSSEVNLRLEGWVASLARVLLRGVALLIDYGYPRDQYYHAERTSGTLMCHYRHRAHPDPYAFPGLQDITAHVDFTAVAEAGKAAGFGLSGFSTQAHFLIGCGLDERLGRVDPTPNEPFLQLMLGVRRLVLPSEMGERFKVLGLQRGFDESLRGFAVRDLSDRLGVRGG